MPSVDSSPTRSLLPQLTLGIAGGGALLLLLFELGFPLSATQQHWVSLSATAALWLGVAGEIASFFARPRYWRRWRFYVTTVLFQLALLAGLIAKNSVVATISARWPQFSDANVESLYLGAWQIILLIRLGVRAVGFNQWLIAKRLPPGPILAASFIGLIVVGTGLLKLPRATTSPDALGWLDALFTSTSAVCVTGLTVVDTVATFTPFGQLILLGLIQLGGLGLMTFAYFFVSVFASVTLKDRTMLLDYLNEDNVGRITHSLSAVIVLTFVCETIGAVLLQTAVLGTDPARASWFDSAFHAVSAFCNAGFSVYGLGLDDPLTRANPGYQIVIMALIVLGGLGFPVLKNLWSHLRVRWFNACQRPPRLSTHTKTVLTASTLLLVGGALLIHVLEFIATPSGESAPSLLSSVFWSVTARTAGFNTAPVDLLAPATVIIMMVLMFVGGAPAGTAGGVKVTTFAIATLNTIRILRAPGEDLVAFGRSIPADVANRSFALALLAFLWVAFTTTILVVIMPQAAPLDAAFEAVSAFATVGLTRGLTPILPDAGKLLIIVTMIVGRIGILYAALSFVGRRPRGTVRYPEANIIIS